MSGRERPGCVLITAGPNREYIDAIHYLGNESTGALAALVANECLARGLGVTFVHGPGSIAPPPRPALRVVAVTGVSDLFAALETELGGGGYGAVFHAMAVSDYVPESRQDVKTASGQDEWVVRFVRAPKVIDHIKQWAPGAFLVACKLEYKAGEARLIDEARSLIARTGADLVVANDWAVMQRGEHRAVIVGAAGGGAPAAAVTGKAAIARAVAAAITAALGRG